MMGAFMKRMCCPAEPRRSESTGAGAACAPAGARREGARPEAAVAPARLEDLIPIAVVLAAGCETCAERMVRHAVEAGSERRHILRTIAIAADLRERESFRANVAPEVVERMAGPIARARATLDELTGTEARAGTQGSCG